MIAAVLPYGHDGPRHERPWVTYGLVLTCVLVHSVLLPSSLETEQEIANAVTAIEVALGDHPSARISFTVEGLPGPIDEIVRPLVDTSGRRRGDPALEAGVRRLVAALNELPAFRFGWRGGAPAPSQAFTSMFIHADLAHLLGNVLILWIAGGLIEVFWNRWAFVVLYVVSGLAGLLAQHVAAPSSLVPLIGASAAIAGLLGALVVGYPDARIKIFYWFSPWWWGTWLAPAWLVIPLWAGVQLLHALLSSASDSGVAYWAHVGGFVFGVAFGFFARRMNLIAVDAGYSVVHDGTLPAARRQTRSVAPAAGPPVRVVVPGAQRASSRPPPAHDPGLDIVVPGARRASSRPPPAHDPGLDIVVPGARRASSRPPPAHDPGLDIVVPGAQRGSIRPPTSMAPLADALADRRRTVRPPPADATRASERPSPRRLPSQPPPRAHEPRAISLDELPPARPGEEIER